MPAAKLTSHAWNERLGLSMILATLVVIGFIVFFLVDAQHRARADEIRGRGVNLVRLLSEMPFEQLAGSNRRGVLQALFEGAADEDLAYGALTDVAGRPTAEVASSGIIIPDVSPGAVPSEWLGERSLGLDGGRRVIEFHAPLVSAGELAGHVRLGYFEPSAGLSREQISFFATISLPIFLLAPVFYLLLRREIRPLKLANREIRDLVQDGTVQAVDVRASGELAEFIRQFNEFASRARERIDTLESEQTRLVTSSKLLTYKRMRVETVLHAFPEAILVLDDAGATSYANAKLAGILGLEVEAIIGRKPAEWCQDEELRGYLARFPVKGQPRYAADSVLLTSDQSPEKSIQVKGYPLFSPQDPATILGCLIVFRDVSEEMLAKRSRGEFVAHVAHELKTPMNVLAMYAEALQGEDGNSESFRVEAVNVIRDEVTRLSTLINNLLSITRIEMGSLGVERQRVKLRDLLQDAFDSVSRGARNSELRFELDLPKELSPVAVDKELLRIAINNLLTNAVKYSNLGGRVSLRAEETAEAILISVEDEGIGISAEDRGRIFEKFYRSENQEVRNRTGHGLGLPLAREIVQLHHGSLGVTSEPDAGSVFVIELRKDAGLLKQAI